MHIFNRPIKDIFLFCLIAFGAWHCLMKELQWAFMFTCILATSIVYKPQTGRLIAKITKLLQDTDHGKVAGIEFRRMSLPDAVGRPLAEAYPAHARLIAELSNQHISLLLHVVREPNVQAKRGQHDTFRELRAHGLVTSKGKIGESAPITATAFGSELAQLLLKEHPEFKLATYPPEDAL